jgi:hypothetical protein
MEGVRSRKGLMEKIKKSEDRIQKTEVGEQRQAASLPAAGERAVI